uniref:Uncharacterized protein n=1 Tax=Cyclophora tenuis TaxID=216820 RepID=A0A7S1D356_CYCTE|mmetsp:Transcript_18139/g.30919  ORF Transcript_18139/g.30919 Transcript_18139/m.30919 type:complete len:135 (+) Transcript_18139:202-606(+)
MHDNEVLEYQLHQYRKLLDSLLDDLDDLVVESEGLAKTNKKLRKQVTVNHKMELQIGEFKGEAEQLDVEICEMQCATEVNESRMEEMIRRRKPSRKNRRKSKKSSSYQHQHHHHGGHPRAYFPTATTGGITPYP